MAQDSHTLPPDVTGTPPWGSGPPPWATVTSSLGVEATSALSSAITAPAASSPEVRPSSFPQVGPGFNTISQPSSKGPGFSTHQSNVLIGVTCLFLVLCSLAVIGRLCARRMSRVKLEADDWMAVFALALLFALSIEQFLMAHYMASMDGPPSVDLIERLGQIGMACQMTYVFLITSARLCVLLLYRRIFSLAKRWFRVAWWFCVAFTLAYWVALLTGFLSACHGIATSHPACRDSNSPASKVPLIVAWSNIGIDACLLVLPMRMVWMLQLSVKRKIWVCALFGLGLIGVAVSTARAAALLDMGNNFAHGVSVAFLCWTLAESAVSLLCANLALLRPIFTNAYNKLSTARSMSNPPGSDTGAFKQTPNISNAKQPSVSILQISPVPPVQDPQSPEWPLETDKGEAQPRGIV